MSLSTDKLKRAGIKPQVGLKGSTTDQQVAKTLGIILDQAIKSRASDVHIEPRPNLTHIRFRINGDLQEMMALPATVLPVMAAHLKLLASLKSNERELPQNGRFTFRSGRRAVSLHISTLPVVGGEKLVLRILDEPGRAPTLSELGIQGEPLKRIITGLHQPRGLVLVTGPPGAGKSTTLYSLLSLLASPHASIATIEATIEHLVLGAIQTELNPNAGLTFASGLRALIRQDPTVIMVGEIRDHTTADLAIQAALTRQLILSTLPTSSAAAALSYLRNLGVEPFLVASAITTVIAQRLVRRLCPHCRIAYNPDGQALQTLKRAFASNDSLPRLHPGELKLYQAGSGCKQCGGTGYAGRIGLYETLQVDPQLQEMIMHHVTGEALQRQAIKAGMLTLQQDGFLKSLQGLTTIEEVLRVTREMSTSPI